MNKKRENQLIKLYSELGFKQVINPKTGDYLKSHDGNIFFVNDEGETHCIQDRTPAAVKPNGKIYPSFSVTLEKGATATKFDMHKVVAYSILGTPKNKFLEDEWQNHYSKDDWSSMSKNAKEATAQLYQDGRVVDHIVPNKNNYKANNLQYATLAENSSWGNKNKSVT